MSTHSHLALDFLIGVHVLGQGHHPSLHIVFALETGAAEGECLVPVAPGVVAEVVLLSHHGEVDVPAHPRTSEKCKEGI